MNFSIPDMQASVDPYGQPVRNSPQDQLTLTPEELKVLRECTREGIFQRAIPMGFFFGLGGLLAARAGPLNTVRFGAKPAVLGLGLFGYMIGRFSYSKICIQRLLEIPDGNFKKMFSQRIQTAREPPVSDFYVSVDPPPKPEDSAWKSSNGTDIDIPSTSNFDTVPSDYYQPNPTEQPFEPPPQNYTSYEELRKQNRDEFSNRFRPQQTSQQQRYPAQPPQDRPPVRRPDPQDSQPINLGKQTKYGDVWE